MHALYHARSSARKFGGEPEDYLRFHLWFDRSIFHINDKRHRAMFHHSAGIQWLQEQFGEFFTNSAGKTIPLQHIGEQHVIEDVGCIPALSDWLRQVPKEKWHGGKPGI